MSQSRARKPQSSGGETVSKSRPSMVKASGDSVPCAPHQSQPKQHSRSKNKIPKSIRYDLENALVGLCDVWFEDIKPYLVRNKIKLHVDTSRTRASGDFGRLPRAEPSCSHLDPACSANVCELCRLLFNAAHSIESAVSQAASAAPTAAASASSVVASDTPRLDFSGDPLDRTNKNSKSKSPRRTRSCRKGQPPPSSGSNRRVSRLCRTYSQLSPRASPRPRIPRVQTTSPVAITTQESCLLALVPRRTINTRNKYTQTEIPYKTKSYSQHRSNMKRTNTEPIPCHINKAPTLRHQHVINLMNTESVVTKNVQPASRKSLDKRSNIGAYPLSRSHSPITRNNSEFRSKMRREIPEAMDVDSVPSKTQQVHSPLNRTKKESQFPNSSNQFPTRSVPSSTRHRSRENRPNTNSAPQQLNQDKKRKDPSIAPPPRQFEETRSNVSHLPHRNQSPLIQPNGHQFWRCFATTNFNSLKNKRRECQKNQKQPETEPSMLFDKELINIIGSNHDKMLRVLYKNSAQEEVPSVMNLMLSPRDREKEASSNKKTRPWK